MTNTRERNALVEKNYDLAATIARRIKRRLPHRFELKDLVQTALVALIEAADRYDAATGVDFQIYARLRIRGAVLNSVGRRGAWQDASSGRLDRRMADRAPNPEELLLAAELALRARQPIPLKPKCGAGARIARMAA